MALQLLYQFKRYSDFAEWVVLPTGGVASGRVCAWALEVMLLNQVSNCFIMKLFIEPVY